MGQCVIAKRRVFFSFHYQLDKWRASIVQNSWLCRRELERESYGFFDAGIWESSKRTGEDTLKRLITDEIQQTSVTCVLAGLLTYQRRWVRYEIVRSIIKGNGLLVTKIHALKDHNQSFSSEGQNPLDYIGVQRKPDGKLYIIEKDVSGHWKWYGDYTWPVSLPPAWPQPEGWGMPLSCVTRQYDYVFQDGYKNFPSWVATAAMEAGR